MLGIGMTSDGANEIARSARGTPRIAGRLLRRVRAFALVAGETTIEPSAILALPSRRAIRRNSACLERTQGTKVAHATVPAMGWLGDLTLVSAAAHLPLAS